ncbi:MAG: hypothetical protein NT154_24405 [Verrucomicrobia bacterium]|nr:hypothetical protein [Verrucomicrobiota bacterium]
MNATETQSGSSLDPPCSALRRKLEVLAYRNRGGSYRRHATEGEIESAAIEGIRLLRHLEQQIARIDKAQNVRGQAGRAKRVQHATER